MGISPADRNTEGLPEGWVLTTLRDVCEINPPKALKESLAGNCPVTFVPMPAVDAKEGAITKPQTRRFSEVRKGFTSFREYDVIMAKITPCMENGKAAIARNLINGQGFGSTEFHVFRSTGAVLPEFIYHFIRQDVYRRAAEAEMTGSVGQKRVPQTFLETTELPLPPLPEQTRIVKSLTALLNAVKGSQEKLGRVPAILKRFRQAVLAAACSGQLTEDWRERHSKTDSVNQQLASLRRERDRLLRNGQRNYHPAPPNPTFEAEVPEGWHTVSLDELCIRITSGSRDWKRYYSNDGPGTFIMAQNVRPLFFDLSYRLRVAPPAHDRDCERSQVKQGDILVTIVGANTGDVCRVGDSLDQYYVCQSVALIRPAKASISPFLELYLNSQIHGQAQFRDWIYGEGRPHLSFDQLRQTAILVPPLKEQEEISRRVHSLFSLANMIEVHLSTAALRAEKLTQSILAKAFRGELVPTEAELARREGREYETASVLLERIKQERDSGTSSKATRPRRRSKVTLASAKEKA